MRSTAASRATAQAFKDSLSSEPILILLALVTVYIVLGILYESYIHPLTISPPFPSAGVGALLFLFLFKVDLSVIAMIGIILLIGIRQEERHHDDRLRPHRRARTRQVPEEAIFEACLLRFRPIMMTTMAALLGGLPLALGTGTGSVDAPPAATLNAMQPHSKSLAAAQPSATNATQLHRGRELPSELDDLLNSLLPDAAAHNAPLPTLPFDDRKAPLQAEQDELEFDEFSSAAGGTDKTKQSNSAATAPVARHAAAAVDDDDDFADFASTAPATSGGKGKAAEGKGKGAEKGRKADSAAMSAEEQQIAAAIIAATKKKGGSFAFSAPSTAGAAAASVVTAIAPPTVAPPSFGPPPPISIVSLSSLIPPPMAGLSAAAATPAALFDVTAASSGSSSSSAEQDDFDADFEQSAAATPFGVGLPSLVSGASQSQQAYFDDEEEEADSSSAAQSDYPRPSDSHTPRDDAMELSAASTTSLAGSASELSGARKNSVSTHSARSTPAPAFDLLDDNHSNHTAPSPSPQPLPAIAGGDLSRLADEDDFAGFASADTPSARPATLVSAPLSVAIPASPTAILPPSPGPSLPSPSTSLAALSSLFAFPALPSPLPLSSFSPSSNGSSSPPSALSMLLSQDRFAEWQLLSAHLKATEELPSLQAQYKEAIAASMNDEEQLPVAMALQARIKKLKGVQPNERWMRPLTVSEQLNGDGSVPSLSYTQLITLLSAANINALPAFSASFPQPFAAALQQSAGSDESSAVLAAARLHFRANRQLRSVVGLLPCHHSLFVSRAATVWSHIASQLAAGVAFVQQVGQLEAGSKKDSRLTAALATASSFLTSLAALYRVHLRLSLARHQYGLTESDGGGCTAAASSVEQSWADMRRGMTKGPWKAAADKSHKQLAGVLAQMDVDRAAEWQALQLTGHTLVDTCELCLGRMDGSVKEKGVKLSVAGVETDGNTASLHQLCANLWRTCGLRPNVSV